MKVKCIADSINSEIRSEKLLEWAKKSELEITVGKTYVVLAVSKYLDILFYYILGDESDNYPLAFPCELFEIIDNRVSKYWDINLQRIESLTELKIENNDIISFKEWALKKDVFYENLLEEKKHEVTIFNLYKNKMICE